MWFIVHCNCGNMLCINSWYDNIRCNFFRTSLESVLIEGTKQYVCTHLNQIIILHDTLSCPQRDLKVKDFMLHKKYKFIHWNNRIQRLSAACTACVVNRDILLSNLEFYVGRSKINDLIKSYLKNRYQRVLMESNDSYQSIFSNWDRVKHSVPLGSILGPLLLFFILTTYQKTIKINSKPVLFEMIQA